MPFHVPMTPNRVPNYRTVPKRSKASVLYPRRTGGSKSFENDSPEVDPSVIASIQTYTINPELKKKNHEDLAKNFLPVTQTHRIYLVFAGLSGL